MNDLLKLAPLLKKYGFHMELTIRSVDSMIMEIIDNVSYETFITLYDVAIEDRIQFCIENIREFRNREEAGEGGLSWAGYGNKGRG
jgi:hypothetical protein